MVSNKTLAAAGAALLLSIAAGVIDAHAAPRNSDCVNCSPRSAYDSDEIIRKIRNSRASAENEQTAPVARDDAVDRDGSSQPENYRTGGSRGQPSSRDSGSRAESVYRDGGSATETYRGSGSRTDNSRDGSPREECPGCPPARKYDSQEVIKTTRDVDKSGVINTTTVVPVAPKYKEHNHLVVHENETRLVGTVQHNNLIVEKEVRYVKRPPVYHHYHVIKKYRPVVQYVYVPVIQKRGCGCNPPPPPCGHCGTGLPYYYVY